MYLYNVTVCSSVHVYECLLCLSCTHVHVGSHAVTSRMQQTSAERIRMTMFPNTIAEGEEVPSAQVELYIHLSLYDCKHVHIHVHVCTCMYEHQKYIYMYMYMYITYAFALI